MNGLIQSCYRRLVHPLPGLATRLCLLLLVLPAFQARLAGARPLPGVIGEDNRRTVPQDSVPWQAVGQINIAGYRKRKSCTGTLIAPDRVLTAAHCLINLRTRQPVRKEKIHFVAGVYKGKFLAHARTRCLFIHPGYRTDRPGNPLPFDRDLALVILRKPLSLKPVRLTTETPLFGQESLTHASYSGDRRHRLTAHKNCRRLQDFNGTWLTDCDTHFGSSGGPVLVRDEAGLTLAAVMVGIIVKRSSIAAPIKPWLDFLRSARCAK